MNAPFAYFGGKNRLAKIIIEQMPKHRTYVEPFAGGARVLFGKTPSKIEVLNDLDGDVTNFFRICQQHHQELIRYLHFHLVSREWFGLLMKTKPEVLTDIQRAARFFYLQRICYGGKVLSKTFGYAVSGKPRYDATKIPEIIEQTHERLAKVQVESLPYDDVLKRYDRPETFFYCDPPYYDIPAYRFNLSEADFEILRDRLKGIKGKFLLSINDVPQVRRLFSAFHIARVKTAYSVNKNRQKRVSELLIRNY
jgi:DNA adenine methylase